MKELIINVDDPGERAWDGSPKTFEIQELVRCKDCVFGKREKNDSTGMTWIYCGHHRENRQEDWFCASGSRI
jgi:hypothetical protein